MRSYRDLTLRKEEITLTIQQRLSKVAKQGKASKVDMEILDGLNQRFTKLTKDINTYGEGEFIITLEFTLQEKFLTTGTTTITKKQKYQISFCNLQVDDAKSVLLAKYPTAEIKGYKILQTGIKNPC